MAIDGDSDGIALQDRFAPGTTCFGCGPANAAGLRLKSRVEGDDVVADWTARPEHEAFAGTLNGGIVGTLIDCHSNWTAIHHLMQEAGTATPPSTVTADLTVKFLRPTPTAGPIHLRARVVESTKRRAAVESALEAGGAVCATGRATFVAVGPGHPAFGRWHDSEPPDQPREARARNVVWTTGTWRVKPGREDEFVDAWREFAEWSKGQFPADRAWLLRRRDEPNVFLSVGPWPTDEIVEEWRGSAGFRERIGRIREMLDGFEPQSLDEAVRIE